MQKQICIIVFIFLVIFSLLGKEAAYVQGEMLIQIRPDLEQDSILKTLSEDFQDASLQSKRLLSKRMNIFLFEFDANRVSDVEFLSLVKQHPFVLEAQFNHYVEQRSTYPNDPSFDDQWALENTGQTGGVFDADIDAPEAWDITTSGVTILGDTLIVAIVDGGCYIAHNDLNMWKNYEEIPGNGIDDDDNGYIDDYDGWNAYNHIGIIPTHSHGTHVSGIAAAIGNNNLGVSGVNWNVKVMPIVGSSGVESIVVEAYGYVLEMRARYNETNGEHGAFVIATNASFGVNYGNPANYPLWSAMYDSLGVYGVLSTGATMNINANVDETGDMPTACDSDYLITVTSTTKNDEKYSSAAYGLTTIDLGAPGIGIISTDNYNTFTYKSGTSMATPHVTGAIALLFSVANEEFLLQYQQQPGEIALLIKQFILDGVDIIPDLENITVSGGRLNIFNSLELLQNSSINEEGISLIKLSCQNYPNPFNPETTIYFTTENAEVTELIIYNLKGQKIRQYSIFNNQSSIVWNGTNENNQPVTSGIYLYKFKSGEVSVTKKMLLLR